MNINLPKKEKTNVKLAVIYTISILTCIIAVVMIIISFYVGTEEIDRLIAIGGKTEEDDMYYQTLEANFDKLFDNEIKINTGISIDKEDKTKDLVYTYYTKNEEKENSYDVNLNIPYININNEIIKKYNQEIKDTFEVKAESVLKTEGQNIAYTVEYQATVEDDILSIIIRSNLKQASSAQRVIIQTYNFDLKNNKEISLEDIINKKELNIDDVRNRIEEKIKLEQKKVQELKSLGYDVFEPDPEDEMYKIENSKEFFINEGNIYIIYAYGNENFTNEVDMVII